MNLQSSSFTQLKGQYWTAKQQHWVRTAVVVCAAIYILYVLALLFWRFIPAPASPALPQQFANISKQIIPEANNNIQELIDQHIFGQPPVATEVVEKPLDEVPETKLNLTLTGVVASTEKDGGAAIIGRNNQQNTYGVGDKIDGTQAVLQTVLNDRVILANRGVKETLMLDGVDFAEANRQIVQQRRSVPLAVTPAPKINRELIAQQAKALRADPTKFTDFLTISPKRENQTLIGYQLAPGKQKEFFSAAGLQPGDVVTQINGLDLSNPRDAVKAMQTLQSAESLDLSILRQGQPISVSLTLP
ncbi:MAG: type II secretion system protein GspC [Glaciecola sp.]|jgi:general secretion pathway protein C